MTRNDISLSPKTTAVLLAVLTSALVITPLRLLITPAEFGMAWDGFATLYGFVFLLGVVLLVSRIKRNKFRRLVEPAGLVLLVVGVYLTADIDAGLGGYVRVVGVIAAIPLIRVARSASGRATMLLLLIAALSLHSVWAVGQFAQQSDFSLQYIGETDFAAGAGVARFTSGEAEKLVRAYGGFSHPNPLGGSLAMALTALLFLVATRDPRPRLTNAWHGKPLMIIAYALSLGIIVSFSRVGLLAAAAAWAVFILHGRLKLGRGGWWSAVAVAVVTLFVFMPLFSARQYDVEDAGVSGRLRGLELHGELLTQRGGYPILGLGVDAYPTAVAMMPLVEGRDYHLWDMQALHSAPLLMLWEVGLLATIVVVAGLLRWFWRVPRQNWLWLLPLLPMALFDHYFFTQFTPLLIAVWFALMLESS